MQLARAAAARTLTDWAKSEAAQAPEPPAAPAAEPLSHREPAPPTPRRAPPSESYKPTDPAVLFTRFAAVVRDCIALEARLSAGPAGPDRAITLQLRADPRRAPLRELFGKTIKNHPDHTDLTREFATRLDEHLTNDPDQTIDPGILLFTIANDLDIELDLAHIPDKYLIAYAATANPDDEDLDPRATSPP